MRDSFGREINYMRISITDRCNLRCRYCMPEGICLTSMSDILTFEEIEQVCRAAVGTGITRFKITGGEPLVRIGCPQLVGMIKSIPGVEQVTLTTNGVLLGKYLDELIRNGIDAVNISLDTMKADVYRQITGFDCLAAVEQSIARSLERGVKVKINFVPQYRVNDEEWEEFARLTLKWQIDVRFIEMMPVGWGKKCTGVSGDEILEKLKSEYPGMKKDESVHGNGPAVYYRLPGALGSVGFISAIHGKFCSSCNRIRMTAEGELKPCLCYRESVDIRKVLRSPGSSIEALETVIREVVSRKPQMHCFGSGDGGDEDRQMVQLGG